MAKIEAVFVANNIGVAIIFILCAGNYFNVYLPMLDRHEQEFTSFLNTLPRIDNDTYLSNSERLTILREQHILTADQDVELKLLQNRQREEILADSNSYGVLNVLGIIFLIFGNFIPFMVKVIQDE